jgi:hypothetical protein
MLTPLDKAPKIACLCGSTRFYDQFQQANYDLTMRGEIVLSVAFYPHAKTQQGHGEGVGHDPAEKTALDELHKRKIDLADYVLVVSDETGYFGDSTEGEIRYAVQHGKPVQFTEPAAALRAQELKLAVGGPPPRAVAGRDKSTATADGGASGRREAVRRPGAASWHSAPAAAR